MESFNRKVQYDHLRVLLEEENRFDYLYARFVTAHLEIERYGQLVLAKYAESSVKAYWNMLNKTEKALESMRYEFSKIEAECKRDYFKRQRP